MRRRAGASIGAMTGHGRKRGGISGIASPLLRPLPCRRTSSSIPAIAIPARSSSSRHCAIRTTATSRMTPSCSSTTKRSAARPERRRTEIRGHTMLNVPARKARPIKMYRSVLSSEARRLRIRAGRLRKAQPGVRRRYRSRARTTRLKAMGNRRLPNRGTIRGQVNHKGKGKGSLRAATSQAKPASTDQSSRARPASLREERCRICLVAAVQSALYGVP